MQREFKLKMSCHTVGYICHKNHVVKTLNLFPVHQISLQNCHFTLWTGTFYGVLAIYQNIFYQSIIGFLLKRPNANYLFMNLQSLKKSVRLRDFVGK